MKPSRSEDLLEIARQIAEHETFIIPAPLMIDMCTAFEGHYWVANFDYRGITDEGRHERVVALCFSAAVLEVPFGHARIKREGR